MRTIIFLLSNKFRICKFSAISSFEQQDAQSGCDCFFLICEKLKKDRQIALEYVHLKPIQIWTKVVKGLNNLQSTWRRIKSVLSHQPCSKYQN